MAKNGVPEWNGIVPGRNLPVPAFTPLSVADPSRTNFSPLPEIEKLVLDSEQPYKSVSVIPTLKEILSPIKSSLEPNIRVGPFPSVEEYLNIHFLLFREDFLRPLQRGIQRLKKNKDDANISQYARVYHNVECSEPADVNENKIKTFAILQPSDYEDMDWENRNTFLPGSFLVLTTDNFNFAYFAVVGDWQNVKDLEEGHVNIQWIHEPPSETSDFTMVESIAFFQSYRYTLKVLQGLQPESMPFSKYIVHCSTSVTPPAYVTKFKKLVKVGGKCVNLLNIGTWPTAADLNMNPHQLKAFRNCLTKEFSIVQGPPGTGKTFLALKLVEVFLNNVNLWNPEGEASAPILIVCYTNHALDQFLEGVLSIYAKKGELPKLLRVGGGGDSVILEPYKLNQYPRRERIGKVKRSRILGMTTTGAAKYENLVYAASPRIVIVEEAAEVVESHIIPCLLPRCQHLILLGDHQQLQPNISAHELSAEYYLDLSLFERMVNNKLHLCTLNVQHRMRPEISELIMGTIYKNLHDATAVLEYPDVLGMTSNVFFITHAQSESPIPGSRSKVNIFEADYLLGLCRYLIQQGYSPHRITILATYKGQVDCLTDKICLSEDEQLMQVDVMTVDGYQGKENDIILVSLVRSNDEGNIGFLKRDNRICVALSRAKHGMYAIGNVSNLAKKSTTWKHISKKLLKRAAIGPHLRIKCQVHGNVSVIKTAADFQRLAPDGGCNRPCGLSFSCGHVCKASCHVLEDHSKETKCVEPCSRTCPNGHVCKAMCGAPCPPCTLTWISGTACSHQVPRPCYIADDGTENCRHLCNMILSEKDGGCGHSCRGSCSSCMQGRLHIKCTNSCEKIQPCGHRCESLCSEECPPCGLEHENAGTNGSTVVSTCSQEEHESLISAFESLVEENSLLAKYFPSLEYFIRIHTVGNSIKLQQNSARYLKSLLFLYKCVKAISKALTRCETELTVPSKLDVVDRLYSWLRALFKRTLPWTDMEISDFKREMNRLLDLVEIYVILVALGGKVPKKKYRKALAELGARKPYDESSRLKVRIVLESWQTVLKDQTTLSP